MPRISLLSLFMGMSLIIIIYAFTLAEGRGTRSAMIESLSFSADDSRILVTKLNSRFGWKSMRSYLADSSRTVSWLDASDGKGLGLIHQDFEPGNLGLGLRFRRYGRTTVLCNPANDGLSMTTFGGGDVILNADSANPTVVSFQYPSLHLASSPSGRLLAASGNYHLTVLDTQDYSVKMRVQANDLSSLRAPLMSFSNDESRIFTVDNYGAYAWDISTAKRLATLIQGDRLSIQAIAVTPEDDLVVCSEEWVRKYGLNGEVLTAIEDKGAALCVMPRAGNLLALYGDDQLRIYDLQSNSMLHMFTYRGVTALAMSSSGDQLAVGDLEGRVALINTSTGERQWHSTPPGRCRWPWTWPATLLLLWVCVAGWLLRRRARRDVTSRHS